MPTGEPRPSPSAAVRRALIHLRELIEDADLRQRDVEKTLGWSQGYLSQVLNGHVELRLRHLELVLGALGVSPAQFFRHVLAPVPAPRRRPARRCRDGEIRVSREMVLIYGFGIEAIRQLHRRLERCERAIEAVAGRLTIKDLG